MLNMTTINVLRSRANELNIDKNKIGIGGFSAGGALSLYAALNIFEKDLPEYTNFNQSTLPDFACLIYPGISDIIFDAIKQKEKIPPMFMVNGAEDDVTPANKCIKLIAHWQIKMCQRKYIFIQKEIMVLIRELEEDLELPAGKKVLLTGCETGSFWNEDYNIGK